jgi:hypothetical protein
MESRESGYRNIWNDSGVNLPEEDLASSSMSGGWPSRYVTENNFPFGTGGGAPGDRTPKHEPRASFDSGRPPTSHSISSYPAPIGPHHHNQVHNTMNGSAPNLNLPLR